MEMIFSGNVDFMRNGRKNTSRDKKEAQNVVLEPTFRPGAGKVLNLALELYFFMKITTF